MLLSGTEQQTGQTESPAGEKIVIKEPVSLLGGNHIRNKRTLINLLIFFKWIKTQLQQINAFVALFLLSAQICIKVYVHALCAAPKWPKYEYN